MSTNIFLNELFNCAGARNIKNSFQLIWLSGLCPIDMPIYVTLTVWSRKAAEPKLYISHSGHLYSFRNSQTAKDIFESGHAILLSQDQINLLTNNGQDMLNLQIIVH